MTNEERENAIRCLKLWIEREPQIQTYKTCLEALEQTTWIPVSERLPDIHNYYKDYLITTKNRLVGKAFFTDMNGKQWWSVEDVIAWMPLPESYKGE